MIVLIIISSDFQNVFSKCVDSNSLLMNRRALLRGLSMFREGYFLAFVLLKDKMIFLTISNSIPHVNGVSGERVCPFNRARNTL